MVQPVNNYYVGRKLRDITQTQGWDMRLVDNITPVIVANPSNAPVEVLPSLPKPNVNQRLKSYQLYASSGSAAVQLITKTNKKIYFLGFSGYLAVAAGTKGLIFWDATSGATPPATTGTTTLLSVNIISVLDNFNVFFPMPIEINDGIRVFYDDVTGGSVNLTVFYIEEDIIISP